MSAHAAPEASLPPRPPEPGPVRAMLDESGQLIILEAAPWALCSVQMLNEPLRWARFQDGCVVIAEQVWYRPVAFTSTGRDIVCELVRDDRPGPETRQESRHD